MTKVTRCSKMDDNGDDNYDDDDDGYEDDDNNDGDDTDVGRCWED